MTDPADDNVIDIFTRHARQCTAMVSSNDLPENPLEYFEENAPYADLKPLGAFLGDRARLRKLLWDCQDNAENRVWDSEQEDKVFEKIDRLEKQVRQQKAAVGYYTDLWTRIEICKECALTQGAEVIGRAKSAPPLSPM